MLTLGLISTRIEYSRRGFFNYHILSVIRFLIEWKMRNIFSLFWKINYRSGVSYTLRFAVSEVHNSIVRSTQWKSGINAIKVSWGSESQEVYC